MTDTAKSKEHYPLDPDFMMDHARALLRVAQEMGRGNSSPASDPDFFSSYGHTIAVSILWSLAMEVALKAWRCREGKAPVRSHDLFHLFCGLEPATRRRLEEAVQPQHQREVLELLSIPALLEGTADPGMADLYGLRDILRTYRKTFEEWRYRYEDPWGVFATTRLTAVLAIVVDEYFKPA